MGEELEEGDKLWDQIPALEREIVKLKAMVWLAHTYLGQDVQAYLDAKYKGTLPENWDEV